MIGNFMADSVKGKKFTNYPLDVQKGILLHRAIDTYTDTHPIVKRSKQRLEGKYGHYSGVIIDIFYDHYLAKNWTDYSTVPLDLFVSEVYNQLEKNIDILPEKTKEMLPFMIEYNWLYNYQFTDGIERVLIGMNRRTGLKSNMNLAIEDLKKHHSQFEVDFTHFFKELIMFSSNTFDSLKI